jgi:hypothetical protein
MKSKLICLSLLICCFISVFSQDVTDVTNVTKVTLLNPGLSYEARIGKFQTAYVQGFMNTSVYTSDYASSENPDYTFYIDPAATVQYRYYYNASKRAEREKRIDMNSMNYVGAVSEFIYSKMRLSSDYFEESSRRMVSRFGIVWGLQRNFEGHFSIDLNLGLGYLLAKGTTINYPQPTTTNVTMPTFMGQLNIGFWLNKRKTKE